MAEYCHRGNRSHSPIVMQPPLTISRYRIDLASDAVVEFGMAGPRRRSIRAALAVTALLIAACAGSFFHSFGVGGAAFGLLADRGMLAICWTDGADVWPFA